jgi:hypothetical protein
MVQPAAYSTSINIHNPALPPVPGTTGQPVIFSKKAVLSVPEGAALIPPSSLVQDELLPDYSEEVDCTVIRSLLGKTTLAATAFIEGWVVIYSEATVGPNGTVTRNPLDVTAVRTDSKGALELDDALEDDF